MTDATQPTDLDFARLAVFATLHGGHLPDVPHRCAPTYRRLAAAQLVTLSGLVHRDDGDKDSDLAPRLWVEYDATITPLGRAVVDAMLAAGMEAIAGQ